MKRSVFGLGMVMAVGLLPAACGPESQLHGELAGPGLEAMAGKPGSEDTNGTPKLAWDTWKEPVARALRFPLLNGDGTINQVILDLWILGDPGGDGAGGEDAAGDGVPGYEVFDTYRPPCPRERPSLLILCERCMPAILDAGAHLTADGRRAKPSTEEGELHFTPPPPQTTRTGPPAAHGAAAT